MSRTDVASFTINFTLPPEIIRECFDGMAKVEAAKIPKAADYSIITSILAPVAVNYLTSYLTGNKSSSTNCNTVNLSEPETKSEDTVIIISLKTKEEQKQIIKESVNKTHKKQTKEIIDQIHLLIDDFYDNDKFQKVEDHGLLSETIYQLIVDKGDTNFTNEDYDEMKIASRENLSICEDKKIVNLLNEVSDAFYEKCKTKPPTPKCYNKFAVDCYNTVKNYKKETSLDILPEAMDLMKQCFGGQNRKINSDDFSQSIMSVMTKVLSAYKKEEISGEKIENFKDETIAKVVTTMLGNEEVKEKIVDIDQALQNLTKNITKEEVKKEIKEEPVFADCYEELAYVLKNDKKSSDLLAKVKKDGNMFKLMQIINGASTESSTEVKNVPINIPINVEVKDETDEIPEEKKLVDDNPPNPLAGLAVLFGGQQGGQNLGNLMSGLTESLGGQQQNPAVDNMMKSLNPLLENFMGKDFANNFQNMTSNMAKNNNNVNTTTTTTTVQKKAPKTTAEMLKEVEIEIDVEENDKVD